MHSNSSKELNQYLETLVSPLEAFYDKESTLADSPCYVQPYPDGTIEELNWHQAGQQIRSIAAHLVALKLEPESKIALLSSNCAHWMMADIAIWMAGHVSVPLYPVLTHTTIKQIIDHSESKAIIIGKLEGYDEMKQGIADELPGIAMPLAPSKAKEKYKNWNDIISHVPPMTDSPVIPITNLATLIYTSGTTGMPKGVMHSFANLGVVGHQAGVLYNLDSSHRKLSYLPLAHAAERASVEMNQLYYGYCVFFNNSLATFADDLKRARPTCFFAVPRIWMKLQQRVLEKIPQEQLREMLQNPDLSEQISNQIKIGLGLDQLVVAISGAAPISSGLMEWYKSIGITILEGYAMSENFAYSHTSKLGLKKIGSVGTPSAYVECKISAQGEILVKSPSNMMGYYKEPKLSAAAIDEDGFLRTGDKGKIDNEGRLTITGRIKEIFKTSKGKYVAPAPIEDLLLRNTAIEQVCVTGANLASPIGIATLTEYAANKIKNTDTKNTLLASIKATAIETNKVLDKHERLACIVLTSEHWTVENNLMTPTLKIKRNELDKKYEQNYETWAGSKKPIILLE